MDQQRIFLPLPLELRRKVYNYLLSMDYTRGLSTSIFRKSKSPTPRNPKLWPKYAYDLHPAILCTNKTINEEARCVLYDPKLIVMIQSNYRCLKQACANVGLTVMQGHEGEFECCAMAIKYEVFHLDDESIEESSEIYRMASTEFPVFCQAILLDYNSWAMWEVGPARLEVSVFNYNRGVVTGNGPTSEQNLAKLLGSVTILRGLVDFRVHGAVSMNFKSDMEQRVSQKKIPVEHLFDEILTMQEEAKNLYNSSQLAGAIRAYHGTLKKLLCCYHSFEYHPGQTGRRAQETYATASFSIQFELQHALMLLHSQLEEWEDAYFWASLATNVDYLDSTARDWRTENQRSCALVLFEKAFISRKMGNAGRVATDVAEAMKVGNSIQMAETVRLGAAVIGDDEGELIAAFRAANSIA